MFESKYGKVLTVILVIVIIAIIGLLAFLGYDYYQKYIITQDTSDFVDNFQGEVANNEDNKDNQNNGNENIFGNVQDTEGGSNSSSGVKTYKGFVVMGTIEIPAISLKYPVLEKVTKKSIETSVAILYGAGVNQPGNTVIIGHNYRNGLFFSNTKKLKINDNIYMTDNAGKKVTYKIYEKFETTPEDTSFYQRDTDGKAEVTLSTCTDDSSARVIVEAKAE